jgi:Phage tail lysozyme
MASSAGYSITIRAVDQTTATLDKINAKIAGAQNAINRKLEATAAPWKRLGGSIGKTINLLGGDKLARGVQQVSKGFVDLTRASFGAFGNISRIVDPLGVITGAATIAGITALEQRFASLGQTLTNTGRLMNMDPAKIAQWEGAVRLTGGSAGDADSSLRGLQYAATDARFGMNNQAAGFLQLAEGPNWRQQSQDINGTAMALSRYIATLKGPARANALRNIQGTFGFTDPFMAMLTQGPAAIQKLLGQAAAHGSPMDSQIGAGNSLAQSINGAQQSIEGLGTAISSKLAPILQPLIDGFSKWVDKNRELIAQNLGKVVSDIGAAIQKIDWKAVWKNIQDVFDKINAVVQSIGGWQTAIIGVIAVLTAAKVASIALPFVQLAAAIAGLTSGPGSFGALGRALRVAGFAVVGGQLVKMGAEAAGAGQGAATVLGDATTGAMIGGAIFGPVGAGIGGALGAAYGGYQAHKESAAETASRADDMTAYYRSQGLSAVQAAALVGGFQQESSLDPTATNGSHYGIGQWDTGRQADFAKAFGHSMQQGTLQEQMQFALDEMFNGKEGAAGRQLLASKTADQATEAALAFERPAAPGTPAWQNEKTWRLGNTTTILARQSDGGKYLPPIDDYGNRGAYPPDNEPQRIIGEPLHGIGMDREDRRSEVVVHVQDDRVTARVRKHAKSVVTSVKTGTPLPAAGI